MGGTEASSEPFTRYQNSVYRIISMGGAGVSAVLGITGFAIGRTLDPIPPPQFFFVDSIVAIVLFGWFLLGMRCRLDVGETKVHVATKYADFRIDRDLVESVEPDPSLWGRWQSSGRTLLVHYRREGSDKVRTRRAFGCLPNAPQAQQAVIEELQRQLGAPADPTPVRVESDGTRVDLEQAVAARLATMEPEGAGSGGAPSGDVGPDRAFVDDASTDPEDATNPT